MSPVAVIAIGAESALGSGDAAFAVGPPGSAPETAIRRDRTLADAGLAKPYVARARRAPEAGGDPATALLEAAARGLVASLAERLPGFRERRVALVVGTSSGGMVSLVDALGRRARGEPVPPELARAASYFGPLAALEAALSIEPCERTQVLAACASSAVALGLAARVLELGHADVAIAGGYDAVSTFVAAGFEALGATSASLPAPFRLARDGMALGEAAVLVALVRAESAPPSVLGYVCGFAASCDAVHVTAPDRTGAGLARAAQAALDDAGLDALAVDLVSAHGTATPFNDGAEARALHQVLGARAADVVVHPFKAVVGHTLGASAALELAAAFDAMKHRVLPGACGRGEPDPEASVRLLARNEAGDPRVCLKLSAAFGGANGALVVSRELLPGKPLAPRGVAVVSIGRPKTASDLAHPAGQTKIPALHLARLDRLSASSVAAVLSALDGARELDPRRTGVVLGTATASLESNEVFDKSLRERGTRGAGPRKFPQTSPNVAPGQCAIAFGLLGPVLSVGAGPEAPLEALLVAHDLVAAGDADAMVVVAAEDVGDVVRDLWEAAGLPVPADGAVAVVLERSDEGLSRGRLRDLLHEARAASGRLGDAMPGFPVLVAALASLRHSEGPTSR